MGEWLPRSGMADALTDCYSRFPTCVYLQT